MEVKFLPSSSFKSVITAIWTNQHTNQRLIDRSICRSLDFKIHASFFETIKLYIKIEKRERLHDAEWNKPSIHPSPLPNDDGSNFKRLIFQFIVREE